MIREFCCFFFFFFLIELRFEFVFWNFDVCQKFTFICNLAHNGTDNKTNEKKRIKSKKKTKIRIEEKTQQPSNAYTQKMHAHVNLLNSLLYPKRISQ